MTAYDSKSNADPPHCGVDRVVTMATQASEHTNAKQLYHAPLHKASVLMVMKRLLAASIAHPDIVTDKALFVAHSTDGSEVRRRGTSKYVELCCLITMVALFERSAMVCNHLLKCDMIGQHMHSLLSFH